MGWNAPGGGACFFERPPHSSGNRERLRVEKIDVDPLAEELLQVAQSLCSVAALRGLSGAVDDAACLVEQASDLLVERSKRLSRRPGRSSLRGVQ
jgi:hypothetical protein